MIDVKKLFTKILTSFVNKSGDTMTGDLNVGDLTHPASVSSFNGFEVGVDPSANTAADGFHIRDKNGSRMARFDAYYWADGYEGLRFGNARTPTGGSSAVGNYLMMGVNASGTRRVSFSSRDPWRTALGLGTSVTSGTMVSSPMSLPTSTYKSVGTVSLTAGTWLILGQVEYPANASGIRYTNIGTSVGSNDYSVYHGASPSGATRQQVLALVSPTSTTTYNLNMYQNSGSSLSVVTTRCHIQAYKLDA